MRRKEVWARPEWARMVTTAVEKAQVERNSSERLIVSAEHELEMLLQSLASTKSALATLR